MEKKAMEKKNNQEKDKRSAADIAIQSAAVLGGAGLGTVLGAAGGLQATRLINRLTSKPYKVGMNVGKRVGFYKADSVVPLLGGVDHYVYIVRDAQGWREFSKGKKGIEFKPLRTDRKLRITDIKPREGIEQDLMAVKQLKNKKSFWSPADNCETFVRGTSSQVRGAMIGSGIGNVGGALGTYYITEKGQPVKQLSAREERDLILLHYPYRYEPEEKDHTLRNVAIGTGAVGALGGMGYLTYKAGKALDNMGKNVASAIGKQAEKAINTHADAVNVANKWMKEKAIPATENLRAGSQLAGDAGKLYERHFRPVLYKAYKVLTKKRKFKFPKFPKFGKGSKSAAANSGASPTPQLPQPPTTNMSAINANEILLSNDPRPRNHLGMFIGNNVDLDPRAMKVAYGKIRESLAYRKWLETILAMSKR